MLVESMRPECFFGTVHSTLQEQVKLEEKQIKHALSLPKQGLGDYEAEKLSPLLQKNFNKSQPTKPEPEPKKTKSFQLWHNCVELRLIGRNIQSFFSNLILYNFNLQLSGIFFSVFNGRIHPSLDFAPDSVLLTKKELVQE